MSATLISVVLSIIFFFLYRRRQYVKRVNVIPGFTDAFLGITGDIFLIRNNCMSETNMGSVAVRLAEGTPHVLNYSRDIWRFWMGPLPHVLVLSPEAVEAVLSSNQILKKGMQYDFLKAWLGQGLLLSSGEKWRRSRKLLTPAFHFKILEDFIPVMNSNGKVLVDKLEKMSKENHGLIDNLQQQIILCTLDVICETAMGIQLNAQRDPESKYAKAVHATGEVVMDRVFKPWLFSDFIFNMTHEGKMFKESLRIMHEFTDNVIKQRKTEIIDKMQDQNENQVESGNKQFEGKKREPFMDTLIHEHIKNPDFMSLINIREEVDTFMFEGHDTTAWGVIWATYLLGLHPEVQAKVHEEVDSIYDSKTENEDLDLDDIKSKLPYLEAVVKESQRLNPSVPLFTRILATDFVFKDIVIPSGINIVVNPRVIHTNPNHWPDPEKFIPERFMANVKRHPYAFIPFSAGPRNCIGQKFAIFEEKALLAKIFRKFKVTSLDQRDRVGVTTSLILKATNPVRVKLDMRNGE